MPFWMSTSKKQVDIVLSVTSSNQIFRYKYDMADEDEEN
jgi:hypothetical protein